MDDLKTPREWAKVTGIEIVRADGWTDRDFSDEITEEEFRYRAAYSFVSQTKPIWNESPQEALENVDNVDEDSVDGGSGAGSEDDE